MVFKGRIRRNKERTYRKTTFAEVPKNVDKERFENNFVGSSK